MEHTSGVVQEIPYFKVQRAVPVLTVGEVNNVMVNWLTYSGVQSCFCVCDKKDVDQVRFIKSDSSSQIQSFARATVCLNTILQWHGAAHTSGACVL